jgi:hypothetical protein
MFSLELARDEGAGHVGGTVAASIHVVISVARISGRRLRQFSCVHMNVVLSAHLHVERDVNMQISPLTIMHSGLASAKNM